MEPNCDQFYFLLRTFILRFNSGSVHLLKREKVVVSKSSKMNCGSGFSSGHRFKTLSWYLLFGFYLFMPSDFTSGTKFLLGTAALEVQFNVSVFAETIFELYSGYMKGADK